MLMLSGAHFYFSFEPEPEERINLELSGKVLSIELADTPEKRRSGLSDREEISYDEGMFFIFESIDYHSMWMKDMNFSIDIIWIDEDLKVVDYKREVSPDTFPEAFSSTDPALYVLETKSGFVDRYSVEVGDKVKLDL